jgi:hypothetical protein
MNRFDPPLPRAQFRYVSAILTASILLAQLPGNSSGQENKQSPSSPGLPQNVTEALKRQAESLDNFGIQYRVDRYGTKGIHPDGPCHYAESFKGRKLYQHSLYHASGNAYQTEIAFDEDTFHLGYPHRHVPGYRNILNVFKADDENDFEYLSRYMDFEFLRAAGFYTPETMSDFRNYYGLESALLRHLKEGRLLSQENLEGKLKVRLSVPDQFLLNTRKMDPEQLAKEGKFGANPEEGIKHLENLQAKDATRTISYLLDPDKNYGIVRREEHTPDEKLILQVISDDWRHYQDQNVDIWLPHRCAIRYHRNPLSQAELIPGPRNLTYVTNFLTNVTFTNIQASFAIDYSDRPGARIRDRASPEAKKTDKGELFYIVSADGTQMKKVSRTVKSNQITPSQRKLYLILFACLAAMPPLFWGLWQLKRRSTAS